MIFSHLQSPSVLPVLPFSKIKGGRVPPSERVSLESQSESDSPVQESSPRLIVRGHSRGTAPQQARSTWFGEVEGVPGKR